MLTESLEGLQYRVSQKLLDDLAEYMDGEEVPDSIYTVASVDEDGIATITWETNDGIDSVTYTEKEVIEYINNKTWILVK